MNLINIYISNTITNKKELFFPINKNQISIYACGPTVYDYIHIGNGRSMVSFDILYRLLKHFYNVKYVRNITDVDDKIIAVSIKNLEHPNKLTKRIIDVFHKDMELLNCLKPNYEPRATEHIADMIAMIRLLLKNGHAYISNNYIYFMINSFSKYSSFTTKNLKELKSGYRIKIDINKRNPMDFVLWKPFKRGDNIVFKSPWGNGRPGWHIECSSMSKKYLGENFDIHCGGIDLIFPHHENEIAQSVCSSKKCNNFANYWVHTALVTINKIKMSKSLKNFILLRNLLNKNITSLALRCFYLKTHYRCSLDFNNKSLSDANVIIEKIKYCMKLLSIKVINKTLLPVDFLKYLSDDLNTPRSISYIRRLINKILKGNLELVNILVSCTNFIGIMSKISTSVKDSKEFNYVKYIADKRIIYKITHNWYQADKLRKQINNFGFEVIDQNYTYRLIRKQYNKCIN